MADVEIKMKDRTVRSRSPRRSRSQSLPSRSLSPSRSRSRSRGRGGGGRERRPARDRYDGPADEKLAMYIRGLLEEKEDLDPKKYPYIHRLISSEIDNITKTASGVVPEDGFIDLYNDTPITLSVKALPPAKVFPKFNYAGRIIGPRGTYLKALMKETCCKMVLLGKGVMKDKEKEQELRDSGDPKFFHLHEDMHVSINVTAPASEAYARVAYALSCLKKQVMNDNRSLESLPWIAHATRVLESGGTMQSNRHPSPPRRPTRPPPNYPPTTYHPREEYQHKSYFERSPQQYRTYAREESPPTRAMEYAAHASRSYPGHSSRRSPAPHSHGYDYPHTNGPPGPPMDYPPHSYGGGGRGSWDPSSGWQKNKPWPPESSPRYAPYKKN